MKKRTAKRLIAVLALSYLILISGGILLYLASQKQDDSKQTLSEADASDNVGLWEKEEEEEIHSVDESDEKEDSEQESEDSIPETQPESTQKEEENTEDSNHVRMVFTGDVYIGNYVSTVYDAKGIQGVLSDELIRQFQTADLSMVNQEFPFSMRGEPMQDKQYTFRVAPEKVSLLTDLGIDVVSLANNHALDYGTDALLDSMETLSHAGITYSGVGKDLSEAKTTRYFERNGKKIAVLSASRVIPVSEWAAGTGKPGMFTTYDPSALLQEIKAAREQADFVVVYLHWGLEKKEYPEEYQRIMGRQFIDAGADIVIGSHPHVLQGFEYYNGKLIAYSLGNFIFSQTISQTAMLAIDADEGGPLRIKVVPCKTVDGQTQELTDAGQISKVYEYLSSISEKAVINSDGFVVEK